MRLVFFCATVLLLTGCQSPGTPWGLRPIAAPVTFGNAPIVNATVHQRESIVGYKQGYSGSITVDSEIAVDVERAGACLHLRSEVLEVDTKFVYVLDFYQDLYRARFNARKGRSVSYKADLEVPTVTASVTTNGESSPQASDNTLIFSLLLEQLHLGGVTVAQDEVVLRYRLGDFIRYLEGEQADFTYSLRIVGETEVDGRPVVVARAEGHIWAETKPMGIDAVIHFDKATGVASHADTRLWHVSGADSDTRIRVVRDMVMEGGAGREAPDRNHASSPKGKCQVEV